MTPYYQTKLNDGKLTSESDSDESEIGNDSVPPAPPKLVMTKSVVVPIKKSILTASDVKIN